MEQRRLELLNDKDGYWRQRMMMEERAAQGEAEQGAGRQGGAASNDLSRVRAGGGRRECARWGGKGGVCTLGGEEGSMHAGGLGGWPLLLDDSVLGV